MRSTNKLFFYPPLILQTTIWAPTRLLFWFFLRLKVLGLENLEGLPRGVIFVSNHTSENDSILIPASLPFLSRFMPMFYVSRPKAFYTNSGWRQFFYGGLFFKLWGAHSAIKGYRDYGVSLSPHIHIVQERHSLLIFPEGRRSDYGKIMIDEAHGGVAFLAEKTGLPLIPVCIKGAFNMSLIDFILRRRKVAVTFGKPIYATDLFQNLPATTNKYKEVAKRIMKIIERMLNGESETHGKDIKSFYIKPIISPKQFMSDNPELTVKKP